MKERFLVFLQFLYRDWVIMRRRTTKFFINYVLINPLTHSIVHGLLIPMVLFGPEKIRMGNMFFVGTTMSFMFPLSFHLSNDLLFDLQGDRFVDYQALMLSPRLLLIQKIIFNTIVTWCYTFPVFPIVKLLLRDRIDFTHTSWFLLAFMLLVGAFFCCAYNTFVACFLKHTSKINDFWCRFNNPMLVLGGFFAPWYAIAGFSKFLGTIVLFNPMLYVSESLRSAVLGDTIFISTYKCFLVLMFAASIFIILSFYMFKRRLDHV